MTVMSVWEGALSRGLKRRICTPYPGKDLVEWRIDLDPSITTTDQPSILTIREDDPEVFLEVVHRYSGYDYLDVPIEIAEALGSRLPRGALIISYHNFETMPSDEELNSLWWRMRRFGQVIKIACMAENAEEGWRMHRLLSGRQNTIVVPMGDGGQPVRIWEGLHTKLWSYACLHEPVAPGQLRVDELLERYRYDALNEKVRLFGLIGDPVCYSVSDVSHNDHFKQMGLDAVYLKMRLPRSKAGAWRRWPVEGLSVTMPLKQEVLRYCDRLDEDVKKIGAGNTLVKRHGEWWGFNTDGVGACNALGEIHGKRMVIVGNGGCARGIYYEAKRRGADVRVMARTPRSGIESEPIGDPQEADILVQATNVGMEDDKSLIEPRWLKEGMQVLECVSSHTTKLMRDAAAAGCEVVGGKAMFFAQAEEQFRLWLD